MGGERNGCGGGLVWVVVVALAVIVTAALFVGKLTEYNDAEASRLYARGALEESYARAQGEIIRAEGQARADMVVAESQARLDQAIAEAQMALAQGQARLDSAQAFAVTAGAALPWLVVALVGVAGVVLLAAIVAIFSLSLAALCGQPSLPRSRRVMLIDRPAQLALPQLQEPGPTVVVAQGVLVKRQDE